MKKRKLKKSVFIIPVIILIILIIIFLISNKPISLNDKFKNVGYSNSDIKIINNLKDPDKLLNYDYNKKYIELIKNKDFKEDNLDKYIEFMNIYNFNLDDIIYVVNNNFFDKNITYTDKTISLMKSKYFKMDNLDRYLAYDSDDVSNIITMVNSGRDYNYYTNVKKTDLSKGFLILVNKYNKLDDDYIPSDLVEIESTYGVSGKYLNSTVYDAYKKMWKDAKNKNLNLYIRSPYRSFKTQNSLYENYASVDGYNKADTYSARPGYSEHQTGLAFDVTTPTTTLGNFETTKEFTWLKENAYKYGFILRYPKDKVNITGYIYESWHYRYVGIEAAKTIYENNLTFEEYYEYYVK